MTNWVHTSLTISGNKKQLYSLKRRIVDNKIFDSLLPTPRELVDTPSSWNEPSEYTEQEKNNIKKYGVKDWYDWNIQNLGTKFGDCRTEILENTKKSIEYFTDFPNDIPIHGFQTISVKYPKLLFALSFIEDMQSFHGNVTIQNGNVIEEKFEGFEFDDTSSSNDSFNPDDIDPRNIFEKFVDKIGIRKIIPRRIMNKLKYLYYGESYLPF